MIVKCNNCSKEINRMPSQVKRSKSGFSYCSKSCSQTINNKGNKRNYIDGKQTYRTVAFREKEHKCERCQYDTVIGILTVHHKDRNRMNNHISNLEILCPNCHYIDHLNNEDGMFTKTRNRYIDA